MSSPMDVIPPQTDPSRPDMDEDPEAFAADENPETVTDALDDDPPIFQRYLDRLNAQGVISFLIVAACTYFVFHELNPGGVVFEDNTPTGGDMGAHVWGPAYLRDELIPNWRLSGWTSDWYLGFPAYQFYFVVPALAIVLLNVGLHIVPAIVLIFCAAMLVWRTYRVPAFARWRKICWIGLVVVSVLVIGMPYGVAFKLVAISGLVAMPACAWALGRLSNLPFPGPPLLATASLLFIFDRSFNITGGNAASTMAGEFSFAIGVCFALLYLGFLIRGLNTGKGRAITAVLLALTGLCHLIPVFFALGATAVVLLVRMGLNQLRWIVVAGGVGGMLSAFWVLPFAMRQNYLNDMGWEKYDTYLDNLLTRSDLSADFLRDSPPLEVMVALAGFGLVVSVLTRQRLGILLGLWAIGVGVVFYAMGEGWWLFAGDRLWNARLLPFYYLCVYLLAALGVGEALRVATRLLPRTNRHEDRDVFRKVATCAIPVFGFLFIFLLVAMPLGAVPGGERGGDGVYRWGPLTTRERNFVPGWAAWNFSGYESKPGNQHGGGYTEYHDIVSTMDDLSEEYGCGQSMWEFAPELDRYGTTMAMMLLPHWTNGCVGSMEGLYFEASPTVPYHFLMQDELSGPSVTDDKGESVGGPSNPMRDLPYNGFDPELGVKHLQMLGIQYYLAFSDVAVAAADKNEDLTPIGESGPWHVYLVADAPRVAPLEYEPVVWDGVSDHQDSWLDPSIDWFQSPDRWDVYQASNGPDDWQRIGPDDLSALSPDEPVDGEAAEDDTTGDDDESTLPYELRPLPEVTVENVEYGRDGISFDVDQVGVPVVVNASYFPNWNVSGADGPYRVAPNVMVVVPTEENVSLTYGRSSVDIAGMVLTILGIGAVIWLARRPKPDSKAWFDWVDWLDLEARSLTHRRWQEYSERHNVGTASSGDVGSVQLDPTKGGDAEDTALGARAPDPPVGYSAAPEESGNGSESIGQRDLGSASVDEDIDPNSPESG